MPCTDSHADVETFAMQPGSPRFPCIHSMHGVGCRLPVTELLTTGTLSPAVYEGACIYIYIYEYISDNPNGQRMAGWIMQHTCDGCMCVIGQRCNRPPKQPLVFVSWSDLPVCTKRLYQPGFGLCPAVFDPANDFGPSSTESSCGHGRHT